MRLRPFTPNALIEEINEDSSQYLEEPEALNEQDFFDNNIPPSVIEQPQKAIPDQSEFEELRADHGITYYERHNIDPDISIPESQAETQEQHPDNASVTDPETQKTSIRQTSTLQYHHEIPCHVTDWDIIQTLPHILIS